MYKKIALVCATLATAGLLMTGCSRNWDTELRKKMCGDLRKVPKRTYSVKEGDITITAEAKSIYRSTLKVTIINDLTGDVLEMEDYGLNWGGFILPDHGYFKGVDIATFNGYSNGLEGLDEKFNEALRTMKPQLEQKILKEIDKVNRNTDLK